MNIFIGHLDNEDVMENGEFFLMGFLHTQKNSCTFAPLLCEK